MKLNKQPQNKVAKLSLGQDFNTTFQLITFFSHRHCYVEFLHFNKATSKNNDFKCFLFVKARIGKIFDVIPLNMNVVGLINSAQKIFIHYAKRLYVIFWRKYLHLQIYFQVISVAFLYPMTTFTWLRSRLWTNLSLKIRGEAEEIFWSKETQVT